LNRLDGFEVPVHRSLVEPMLMAGLPRTLALVLWTTMAAFAFGLRQLWVLPIGLGLHLLCAAVTRADPYFFDILIPALKAPKRLDP
jgi:type IV secretion system protein TrbD